MKSREEIYSSLEKIFDEVDSIISEDILSSFGKEEGEPIDREVALLQHLIDGLLTRIERLGFGGVEEETS